jgi:NTE family protein
MPDLPPEAPRPEQDRAAPAPTEGVSPGELPPEGAPTDDAREAYLPSRERKGVALCLSGGGYRAALFHLGAVRRLNELGVLGKIDTITGVSGGSIMAAHLATTIGSRWPTGDEVLPDFETTVARTFHRVANRNIRTWPLIAGLVPWNLFRGHAAVTALEGEYRAHLTRLRLSELPARPWFVFCATDMTYGVNWTFTRDEVGSYMAGYAPTPAEWTVARAVAASSCFPPFFNPQPIGLDPSLLKGGRDPQGHERTARVQGLRLSDGGLYDNMGLELVWKSHAVILVSDGGSTFDAGADNGLLWRLNRYVEVIGRQSGAQRKRWLISNFVKGVLRGTYWGIGTDIGNYAIGASGYPFDLVRRVIAEIRTDLDRFEEPERAVLENHGYLLADAAVRRHADFLASPPRPDPAAPYQRWMDPELAEAALSESSEQKFPFGRGWP